MSGDLLLKGAVSGPLCFALMDNTVWSKSIRYEKSGIPPIFVSGTIMETLCCPG